LGHSGLNLARASVDLFEAGCHDQRERERERERDCPTLVWSFGYDRVPRWLPLVSGLDLASRLEWRLSCGPCEELMRHCIPDYLPIPGSRRALQDWNLAKSLTASPNPERVVR